MVDISLLGQFHFLRPLWFFILVPLGFTAYLQWRRRDLRRQWQAYFAPHLLPLMLIPGSQRQWFSPLGVFCVLAALTTFALAGPSWQRGDSPFAEDSAALIIAVDLSASMAGSDLQPSRLQRARAKALQIAQARGDAYTALLAYAGTAHTVLPLTSDSGVLLHYLDALQVGMLPREGKAPERAVDLADAVFSDKATAGTLLLIGDGASDEAARHIAERPDSGALQLLVWGMGKTAHELDKDRERGLRVDAQPLQEAQLKALAGAARGHYLRVSTDDRDVREILRRIDRHYQLGDDSARPWVDAGYKVVPLIMLLFLLWFRRGWVLPW